MGLLSKVVSGPNVTKLKFVTKSKFYCTGYPEVNKNVHAYSVYLILGYPVASPNTGQLRT